MPSPFVRFAAPLTLVVLCTAAAPTTRQSIEQLNSDDPVVRTNAEARLAAIGSPAIEPLCAAVAGASPEARVRALRALRRIELFRLRDVPTQQLALADAYLNATDFANRKLQLNLLFASQPAPAAVLTRLVPLESDLELRHEMLYRLYLGYRENVARIIADDDDIDALLTIVDGAATMWGQKQAADDALAQYLTGHLDEQIARWTAEQANGDTADQQRAAGILCQLYRISGKYDQAMRFARLSREPELVFLVLQDEGDWAAAAKEPDDRWHDATMTAAFHACFLRLAGHPQLALDALSPHAAAAAPDSDNNFNPSRVFLLNDLPEDGLKLLLPRHPAVAFQMRVTRGEISQAIQIAEQYEDGSGESEQLAKSYKELRQSLGELPAPATQPAAEEGLEDGPMWRQWAAAVDELNHKQFKAAADHFAALWAGDKTRCDDLYLQGYALRAAGATEQGEKLMSQAELIPLGDPRSRWELAARLDSAGLTDAAGQQRALALHTGGDFAEFGFSDIWDTRKNNAIAHKQWKEAADALDRLCLLNLSPTVVLRDPQSYLFIPALAHLCKARDARQRGDLSTTMGELDIYQKYLPIASDMVLEFAPALDDLGEHARADALFDGVYDRLADICRKYPKSQEYLNNLAWMSACCGRRLDQALQAAEAAVALSPDSYLFLDTLAEVHFRRGERQAAIALEQRAARLSTDPYLPYLQRQLKRFQSAAVPSTTRPGPAPQ